MHCISHTVHVRQTRLIVLQNLKEVLTEPIGGLPKKKQKKKKKKKKKTFIVHVENIYIVRYWLKIIHLEENKLQVKCIYDDDSGYTIVS